MPEPFRFVITGRLGARTVARTLEPSWRTAVEEARPVVRRYLDTFDWALWRSGGRLLVERDGRATRLRWEPAGGRSARTMRLEREPRFAADLPAGVVRREVADAAGERALLPAGQAEVRRTLVRVADGRAKTVARVWLETARTAGEDAPTGPGRRTLRVEPLTGYAAAGAEVAARLAAVLPLAPDERDELADAAAAAGRTPGDYTSKVAVRLTPGEPAERAVRRVLSRLLATLAANVEGTVRDLDPEFLHDLRVATRRTRTCLGQLRGVLSPGTFAPFAEEFRWLGDATSLCRDLDVFLLDLEARRREVTPAAAANLGPLIAHLRARREEAHRALAGKLESARFTKLVRRWQRVLGRRAPGGEDGARPIAEVAGERTLRTYRRLVRHGEALPPDPPATAMHRLRIDAKKLRYLLEFFAGLWDAEAVAAVVRELRAVQDALGRYHDAWIQSEQLPALGGELIAAGAGAGALLAMGELAAALNQRQAAELAAFADRFAPFAAEATRARLVELVAWPGGVR